MAKSQGRGGSGMYRCCILIGLSDLNSHGGADAIVQNRLARFDQPFKLFFRYCLMILYTSFSSTILYRAPFSAAIAAPEVYSVLTEAV